MIKEFRKAAFLFPGQGVRVQGIIEYYLFLKSKDNAGNAEKFLKILQDSLNEVNPEEKFEISKILENESSPSWEKTSFIQPLTYALSILTYELVLNKLGVDFMPVYMLGHSFGAFSALTASGALSFTDGARVVAARGKFMQADSERADKGMLAIIGLEAEKIDEICKNTGAMIALINAPTAYVVGCARNIFSKVEKEAASLGNAKIIRLNTSGAFHTPAMRSAYEKFKEFLSRYSFIEPKIPIVTNIKSGASSDPEELKNDVVESMINPVNWARMIGFLKNEGTGCYVELGPGTSLSSLCKMNGIEKESIIHSRDVLV